jgi:hypothetical protein
LTIDVLALSSGCHEAKSSFLVRLRRMYLKYFLLEKQYPVSDWEFAFLAVEEKKK